MRYRKLGTTDLEVSVICLGTMTFGEQNSQQDGFDQMDYALERGVNFFDTAELYAVMPRKETYGKTEEIVGNWIKEKKNREKIILASKNISSFTILSPLSYDEDYLNYNFHLVASANTSLNDPSVNLSVFSSLLLPLKVTVGR